MVMGYVIYIVHSCFLITKHYVNSHHDDPYPCIFPRSRECALKDLEFLLLKFFSLLSARKKTQRQIGGHTSS